ncbi:MAG: YkgJ family cysteine cluster protein [Methanobacteriota archaeon]|nr:MAG: YkgJ family cysteine cluster protein [Euryarchaeota archaeon]
MGKFVCRRCGKCCKERWEITVDFHEDILRWIRERRFDILKHVVINPKFLLNPGYYHNRVQWIIDTGHVLFGDVAHRCPFLEEATGDFPARCRIHETRPQVCRRFPYDEQGRVREDILDVCMGSIFYHSKKAEEKGLELTKYIRERRDLRQAPDRWELKEIARAFRDRDLKIPFTSDIGLRIAEELLEEKALAISEILPHSPQGRCQ